VGRLKQEVPPRQESKRCWVTQQYVAQHLGITPRTVRQLAADGIITGYRMRKRFVRYDLNEIDAALQPFGGSRYDLTEVDDALKPYGGGPDASPEKAESRPDPATSGRPSPTRHTPPAPYQKPFPNNSKGQIR
jgi:hypothetical protein